MKDKYILETEAVWEIGAGGDTMEPFIVARVKETGGEPVTGLKKSDFVVYDMGFGFGNINISIAQEIAAEAPSLPFLAGTYRLKLKISNMMKGQFVFAVIVKRRGRKKEGEPSSLGQSFVQAVKLK